MNIFQAESAGRVLVCVLAAMAGFVPAWHGKLIRWPNVHNKDQRLTLLLGVIEKFSELIIHLYDRREEMVFRCGWCEERLIIWSVRTLLRRSRIVVYPSQFDLDLLVFFGLIKLEFNSTSLRDWNWIRMQGKSTRGCAMREVMSTHHILQSSIGHAVSKKEETLWIGSISEPSYWWKHRSYPIVGRRQLAQKHSILSL